MTVVELPGAVCACGARLHAVPHPDLNEWVYLDENSKLFVDRTPDGYREDPSGWWARLATEDIAAYSDLSAQFALGMVSWSHTHRPVRSDPFTGWVLWCCDMPMRLAPRGWVCRVTAH